MGSADEPRSLLARTWTGIALWKRIFAALLLGVAAGLLFGEAMMALVLADHFLRHRAQVG